MREKKEYRVITFHTTAQAMRFEKMCMEQAIPGRLIPVPTQISAGCGLAWRIPEEDYAVYAIKLEELEPNRQQVVAILM